MPYIIRLNKTRGPKHPDPRVKYTPKIEPSRFYFRVCKQFGLGVKAQYTRANQSARSVCWGDLKVQHYDDYQLWTASSPGMVLWLRMNQPDTAIIVADT